MLTAYAAPWCIGSMETASGAATEIDGAGFSISGR